MDDQEAEFCLKGLAIDPGLGLYDGRCQQQVAQEETGPIRVLPQQLPIFQVLWLLSFLHLSGRKG